ncbi:hypothetical protein GQ55_3G296100 [Panicum hallii var. hallii]|uniref:Uncharacterized protein n=2 Tax=Panicum hallii TaxID=206008 RepID=A0A2T7EEN7_9POAL|nr:hypothetical protein GQ55_3G296100 [Panicum hallii var. hallii]PVH62485.1 hypothetical protein PAHAL_3G306600 [Panicum hallii]
MALPLQGKVDMARIPRLLTFCWIPGHYNSPPVHIIICVSSFISASVPPLVFSLPFCSFAEWGLLH